jgi:hypothetical protein
VNYVAFREMDGTRDQNVKQNKPDSESHILHVSLICRIYVFQIKHMFTYIVYNVNAWVGNQRKGEGERRG